MPFGDASAFDGDPALGSLPIRQPRSDAVRQTGVVFARVLLVVAATWLVPACSQEQVNCILIGAESGVSFEYSQVSSGVKALAVHACVRSKCVDQTANDVGRIFVADDTLDGAGPFAVGLTIKNAAGTAIFSAHTNVSLEKRQPNGPKCPPTVWSRSLTATSAGDFVEN